MTALAILLLPVRQRTVAADLAATCIDIDFAIPDRVCWTFTDGSRLIRHGAAWMLTA